MKDGIPATQDCRERWINFEIFSVRETFEATMGLPGFPDYGSMVESRTLPLEDGVLWCESAVSCW